jgi:hypothetical protein
LHRTVQARVRAPANCPELHDALTASTALGAGLRNC